MRHASAVVVLCLAVLTACGEVPKQEPDGPPPPIDAPPDPCTQEEVSIDDFFTCLGRRVCDIYEDCFASDADHLDCENLPLQVFGNLPPAPLKVVIKDAVGSGRAQWDPRGAKACLDLLGAVGPGQCTIFKQNGDPFRTCRAIIGNINNGQACQNDIECATPGAQCVGGSTDQCMGYTCRAPVAAGQACTGGAFCRPEDRCIRRVVSGTDMSFCATGEEGQACDRNSDCDKGFYCNGGLSNSTASGICTAAKPAGSTCLSEEECQGELGCVGNFSGASGTCRDIRATGAACDTVGAGYTGCWGHQYCDGPSGMLGMCRAAPDLGQACGAVQGMATFCGFFGSCEAGNCKAPGNVGEACMTSGTTADGCNLGLWCDSLLTGAAMGVCAAPGANGAQCKPDSSSMMVGRSQMCASNWCSNGVCTDFPTCNF